MHPVNKNKFRPALLVKVDEATKSIVRKKGELPPRPQPLWLQTPQHAPVNPVLPDGLREVQQQVAVQGLHQASCHIQCQQPRSEAGALCSAAGLAQVMLNVGNFENKAEAALVADYLLAWRQRRYGLNLEAADYNYEVDDVLAGARLYSSALPLPLAPRLIRTATGRRPTRQLGFGSTAALCQ